jgi:hypothetical protein
MRWVALFVVILSIITGTSFAGDPTSYPPATTPYTGGEKWYCDQNGTDRQCSTSGVFTSGSWTPVLVGTSVVGSATYTYQVGSYQLVGNLVEVQFYIQTSAIGGGMSGTMAVSGLPLMPAGLTINDYGGCFFYTFQGWTGGAGYTWLSGMVFSGTTRIQIVDNGSGKTSIGSPISEFLASGVVSLGGLCAYHI